jgi:hypothetical protein
MLLPRLMDLIEHHADELVDQALADLSTNPRTPSFRGKDKESTRERMHDVVRNLSSWLATQDEARIEGTFGEYGRRRRLDGTPLEEIVYAMIIAKERLWSFVERNDVTDSPLELDQERELIESIGRFFDRAMYHTVRGYQHAAPEAASALAAGRPTR